MVFKFLVCRMEHLAALSQLFIIFFFVLGHFTFVFVLGYFYNNSGLHCLFFYLFHYFWSLSNVRGAFNKVPDFFVQAFEIVVDP